MPSGLTARLRRRTTYTLLSPQKQPVTIESRGDAHKIHVMQIICDLGIGGAQEMVRTLAAYLASIDCEVVVCTFKDGPVRESIERLGVRVEVLPERRHSVFAFPLFVLESVQIFLRLARLVRRHQADVVQTHLLRTLEVLVLLLPLVTPVRVILWTMHSAKLDLLEVEVPLRHRWLLRPKRYAHRQLYRLVSRWVGGYVAVSDQVRETVLRDIDPSPEKITVIYNGVDLERYRKSVDRWAVRIGLGLGVHARLIATVGTLWTAKGHRYLVEAMAAIVPRQPDVHALLIGDGDLRGELQEQVRRLGLQKNVHFLGSSKSVPELLAASDLFVLPSLWEGLSMALLEAMATGLPIVASEVSGTLQAITANESGVLVPPGDPGRLAEAIELVLSDPKWAREMGSTARQRAERDFSAEKQAQEHLALYRRLLAAR